MDLPKVAYLPLHGLAFSDATSIIPFLSSHSLIFKRGHGSCNHRACICWNAQLLYHSPLQPISLPS